jgi:hypothetical protein
VAKKKPYPDLPEDFLKKLRAVTAKRPKTVIDHILKFGHVTTEELRERYGYDHPPRAIRDVKEHGIPLEMFRVEGSHGRKIAAYRLGDPSQARGKGFAGRRVWPKEFKKNLVGAHGERCAICCTVHSPRYLQIDHRIPFEVIGEDLDELKVEDYMLLCGSCNRAKSWSCEHCRNWSDDKDVSICETCYWASPTNYLHIALQLIRRVDITWTEHEVSEYDRLLSMSKHGQQELPEFVKDVLRHTLRKGKNWME